MNDPISYEHPQVGDVAIFTGELLPELQGPAGYVLVSIDTRSAKPLKWEPVIEPLVHILGVRDTLTGTAVIRNGQRGVYR